MRSCGRAPTPPRHRARMPGRRKRPQEVNRDLYQADCLPPLSVRGRIAPNVRPVRSGLALSENPVTAPKHSVRALSTVEPSTTRRGSPVETQTIERRHGGAGRARNEKPALATG